MNRPVELKWLAGSRPGLPTGITWGVPWPKAERSRDDPVCLRADSGVRIPVQSWPIGYWPDGSVKWTALTAVLGPDAGALTVERGEPAVPDNPLACEANKSRIRIVSGDLAFEVGRTGTDILRIFRAGQPVCAGSRLVGQRVRYDKTGADTVAQSNEFVGDVETATLEQSGPLRAVVKLQGTHRDARDATFLRFVLRIYFYANSPCIRLVHTFIYDAEPARDFLGAVGLRFYTPLREKPHNRWVLFAGDGQAVWRDSVRGVPPLTPRSRWPGSATATINPDRARHVQGSLMESPAGTETMPVWNRFVLLQTSDRHFCIRKGCDKQSAMIDAMHGHRGGGLAALADSSGGLAVGLRDFWQSHPSALSVEQAGSNDDPAELTAWLWPPQAEPADMRHYSLQRYGTLYEDFPMPGDGVATSSKCLEWAAGPADLDRSNAHGIARTSELTLWALEGRPSREQVSTMAQVTSNPPLLVCRPETYHEAGVFGVWSLTGSNNKPRVKIEQRLTELLDHYVKEVEIQSWYGFWHYGDIMHSYDLDRHQWRYDEGGCAWNNSECLPDIWLWFCFLRTGRADVFRMAEAMTRHTSEVDTYHLGPLAGLGSRHNVIHWGCSCKEARISFAGCRRFFYFLTADERTGDILTETCDAWPEQTREIRLGPTWTSLCWNWVTAWERTADNRYRDKILHGIEGILDHPTPIISEGLFAFDPVTGAMTETQSQEPYYYFMLLAFGGSEIWLEMVHMLGHKAWNEALADFGEFLALDPQQRAQKSDNPSGGEASFQAQIGYARMMAFAAARRGKADVARQIWDLLLGDGIVFRDIEDPSSAKRRREMVVHDLPVIGVTPCAAQWSLAVIGCLALIDKSLPQ